jgi:hypothetical protein
MIEIERLTGEDDLAYEAAEIYISDLGRARSLEATYRRLTGRGRAITLGQVHTLASLNFWIDRALTFDRRVLQDAEIYQEKQRQDRLRELEAKVEVMREELFAPFRAYSELTRALMAKHNKRRDDDDLIRAMGLMEVSARLARLSILFHDATPEMMSAWDHEYAIMTRALELLAPANT